MRKKKSFPFDFINLNFNILQRLFHSGTSFGLGMQINHSFIFKRYQDEQ